VPPDRDPLADLVRSVAIWLVVLGHWTVVAVTDVDGTIDGINALARIEWARWATWIFQVMPLFFFVGGFANATSMAHQSAAGGDLLAWVVRRFRRLLLPSSATLGVLIVVVGGARLAGVDQDALGTGAWVATVPLWFLAVYLVNVAVAPLTHAAHRRWGLAVPALLCLLVALFDVPRLVWGDGHPLSDANYLLAWLAIHQLGYAWHDGRLPGTPRVGVPMALGGGAALVALTVFGPYAVTMVATPGEAMQNSEPPTIAMLALAVTQIGIVMAVRDAVADGTAKSWHRRLVRRVQPLVLSLFLWHMAAAVLAAAVLYGTGAIPVVTIATAAWWWWRLPWLAGCAVLLAALVALFAPLEGPATRHRRDARVDRPLVAVAAVAGVVLTLAGMLGIAVAGPGAHGPLALPTAALASFAAGVSGLLVASVRLDGALR
jgi:fucose 4-O-acetylase-like acetyltransferase